MVAGAALGVPHDVLIGTSLLTHCTHREPPPSGGISGTRPPERTRALRTVTGTGDPAFGYSVRARRPAGRTGAERGLDGVGDELRGLGVDGDVAAQQHRSVFCQWGSSSLTWWLVSRKYTRADPPALKQLAPYAARGIRARSPLELPIRSGDSSDPRNRASPACAGRRKCHQNEKRSRCHHLENQAERQVTATC